jgi:hypothetical protein
MSLTKVSYSMITGAPVNVRDFGAVGDGSNDDTAAIVAAIAYCQANGLQTLYLGAGTFKITSTITLPGSNSGIAIVGQWAASAQQGSVRPSTTIRWYGGASPMFTVSGTYYQFYNFAIDNFGTATNAFNCTTTMTLTMDNISFDVGAGATKFSGPAIKVTGDNLGYSVFNNCNFIAPSATMFEITGAGGGLGITPLLFYNCLIESGNGTDFTFLKLINTISDIVTFQSNTINGQGNYELCLIDISNAVGYDYNIGVLNFFDNEVDFVSVTATDRLMRLKNVRALNFWGNQLYGDGTITALVNLENSVVAQCYGNTVFAINGPVFSADSTSRVYSGVNYLNPSNTNKIVNDTAATSGLIEMPYGTTVIVKGGLGVATGTTIFRTVVTNATAFSLEIARPADSSNQSYMTRGQVFGVMLKNTSGGAITVNPEAAFKLAGGAFPVPATGYSRTVTFVWDGTYAVEIGRTTADVPN